MIHIFRKDLKCFSKVFCWCQKLLNCEGISDVSRHYLPLLELVTQVMSKDLENVELMMFWPSDIVPSPTL